MRTLTATNALNAGVISNDISYVVFGHNEEKLQGQTTEMPTCIYSRFSREWKVENTNFNDDFSIDFKWDSVGNFDINDIRLLVDTDGDFTDATVFSQADGLTFSGNSIIISNISTSIIPSGSTRYITVGSVSSDTPLPVKLLNFEANHAAQNKVQLTWETSSEVNNDYFSIERSIDGVDWGNITDIAGAGNSYSIIRYSAMDDIPYVGTAYYRLKQTDFNGDNSYSNLVSIIVESVEEPFIHIFPNPASTQITITGSKDELDNMIFYNLLEQDVTDLVSQIETEELEVTLDLSSLNAGLYYLKTKNAIHKIFKQ
jgi:hypothetical protein